VSKSLVTAARRLGREAGRLEFDEPVAYVYNPLEYAWTAHRRYLERFGGGRKQAILIGMNPGPWGMAQTGVPFGEIAAVRDWMGIEEKVARPELEHAKRPIEGFACRRSEVSGRRLWGWARDRFGTATEFFARFWVHNYCPLAFLEDSGRNRTPDKLPASERAELFAICDQGLRDIVELLEPSYVIGVGAFAEKRAKAVLGDDSGLTFGRIPHPSPASPAANRGWAEAADAALDAVLR